MTTSNKTSIGRRSMLKLTLGSGAAALLATNPVFAQDTTLKMASYGGQDLINRIGKALELFVAKHPGVKTEFESAPFADFFDRLAVQYSGGGAPDMHRHSMTYLYDYQKRGLLADLSGYLGKTIDTSELYPGVVEIGTQKGAIQAIGNNQIALALFYDVEKFKSAGLEDRLATMGWDDFREIASKVGKAGGEKHYGTNDAGGFLAFFEQFLYQKGITMFPAEGGIGFTEDDCAEWFEFWAAMRADQGAPPAEVSAEAVGMQNSPLVKGIGAMNSGWCQQLVFFQDLTQRELNVTRTPVPKEGGNGHFIRALDFWVIPEQSKHKDLAAELINFFLNDPEAIATLGISLGGPPSAKATRILSETATPTGQKVMDYLVKLREGANKEIPIWVSGWAEFEGAIKRTNDSVGFGKLSPKDAGEQLFDEADRIFG